MRCGLCPSACSSVRVYQATLRATLQGARKIWAHAIVVGIITQPIAQTDSGTSETRRGAHICGVGKSWQRSARHGGAKQRGVKENTGAYGRREARRRSARGAFLWAQSPCRPQYPAPPGTQSRTPRERAPSPGKRVEPRLAGIITAAREEENRAMNSGAATAEDRVGTIRGLRPATPVTIYRFRSWRSTVPCRPWSFFFLCDLNGIFFWPLGF